jgi:hypothetical protein
MKSGTQGTAQFPLVGVDNSGVGPAVENEVGKHELASDSPTPGTRA